MLLRYIKLRQFVYNDGVFRIKNPNIQMNMIKLNVSLSSITSSNAESDNRSQRQFHLEFEDVDLCGFFQRN